MDTKLDTLPPGNPCTMDVVVSPSPSTIHSVVETDDQIWETKLAATPAHVVDNLAAKVRADIAAGKTRSFKSTKRK
ncbi:MAG: hypothetical protein JWN14_3227 [Chthonomonadales bacterium]|nr:hypothetical protein [Chthonomonadales bacterium]